MHLSKIKFEAQYMHWQLIEKSGLIVAEGEQHNLVLNQASEQFPVHGFDGVTAFAVVGTGSTAPNVTQTGLTSELVRTSSIPNGESDSITLFANGVYDIRRVKEFSAAQVGTQNLTEWGFAPVGSAGANLAVRELFRDGSNNPITITPSATQSLRIVYVSRVTLTPVIAQNVSVNIAGVGNRSGQFFLSRFDDFNTVNQLVKGVAGFCLMNSAPAVSYNTNFQVGNTDRIVEQNASAYVANSKTRTYSNLFYGANNANGWIFGLAVRGNSNPATFGSFGGILRFDDGQEFEKTSTFSLTIAPFGVSWT
jgi:hypothetical protein